VNTGWTGGPYGIGSRIKLGYTRAIVDAIHDGSLLHVPAVQDHRWRLMIPTSCPRVPSELLQPRHSWRDPEAYDQAADQLAALFRQNYQKNFGSAAEGL
jgi:phosphoenolpyruvate carboxykinase (ATP)